MKLCLRLTLFLCLLLPTLSARAQKTITLKDNCGAGNAFTLRVPIPSAANVIIDYQWYRNGAAVTAVKRLPTGATGVAYTIPPEAAFGTAVTYHFRYSVDNCDWHLSDNFVLTFYTDCVLDSAGSIYGDDEYAPVPDCTLDDAGFIVLDDTEIAPEVDCVLDSAGSIFGEDVVPAPDCTLDSAGSIVGDDDEVIDSYCVLDSAGSIVLEEE